MIMVHPGGFAPFVPYGKPQVIDTDFTQGGTVPIAGPVAKPVFTIPRPSR